MTFQLGGFIIGLIVGAVIVYLIQEARIKK